MAGAAIATMAGQGMTMLLALIYLFVKRHFVLRIPLNQITSTAVLVLKVAAAPFGLAMSPNISLMIINRFSASYGGEAAIAVYACIAYMISVISLVLQGVGDGSQPLISKYYGTGSFRQLRSIRSLAYGFSLLLADSLSEKEVEALFYFQINGCFAVSRKYSYLENGEWCPIQNMLDRFIKGRISNFPEQRHNHSGQAPATM